MFVGLVTSIICTALSVFAAVIAYVLPLTTNVAMSPAPPISLNPSISSVSVSIATMLVGTEGLVSRHCMVSVSEICANAVLDAVSVSEIESDNDRFLSKILARSSLSDIDSDNSIEVVPSTVVTSSNNMDSDIETLMCLISEELSVNERDSDSVTTVLSVSEILSANEMDSASDTAAS